MMHLKFNRSAAKPIATLLGLLACFVAGIAHASPYGELDPRFGNHGRILLRDAPFEELEALSAVEDPATGKLRVLARGWYQSMLLGLRPDGSLDPDFGAGGFVKLALGDDHPEIADVVWLPGGDLLLAGAEDVYSTASGASFADLLLAKVHSDGSPDEGFGVGGRAVLTFGGTYDRLSAVEVLPDGRILVLGSTNRSGKRQSILARLTADGRLDTAFANNGTIIADFLNASDSLHQLVIQPDGKLVACGEAPLANAQAAVSLLAARLSATGSLDSTFGNNGVVRVGEQPVRRALSACRLLADGSLILAGQEGEFDSLRGLIVRLAPDGSRYPAFGSNGIVRLPTTSASTVEAVTLLADGSLAIAGTLAEVNVEPDTAYGDFLVAHLDAESGAIDTAFGAGGFTRVDFGVRGYGSLASAKSLLELSDGSLVVLGAQYDRYDWYLWTSSAMARVNRVGTGSSGVAGFAKIGVSVAQNRDNTTYLRVRRTGGSTGELSVAYRTIAGTATAGEDYVEASGTLTWPDGDLSDRSIGVAVLAGAEPEDYETFYVELVSSNGGLSVDQATVQINKIVAAVATPPPSGSGVTPAPAATRVEDGGGGSMAWLEVLGLLLAARGACLRRSTTPKR